MEETIEVKSGACDEERKLIHHSPGFNGSTRAFLGFSIFFASVTSIFLGGRVLK